MPIDVVKTRLQMPNYDLKNGYDACCRMVRDDGFLVLFKGCANPEPFIGCSTREQNHAHAFISTAVRTHYSPPPQ